MVQYIHNIEILQYAIFCFQGFLFSLRVKDKTSQLLFDRYNFWIWNKKYFMNKNPWHSIFSDTILEPRDHLDTVCQQPDLMAVMGGLSFAVEQHLDSKKRLNKFSAFLPHIGMPFIIPLWINVFYQLESWLQPTSHLMVQEAGWLTSVTSPVPTSAFCNGISELQHAHSLGSSPLWVS